jgi:hypothetical protein
MIISKVSDRTSRREFLDVAKIIYDNDAIWVCPIDKNLDAIFDPEQNTYYNHGTAERWLLKDGNGKLIGRIAAFIDYKRSAGENQPTGGIGICRPWMDR